MSKKRKNYRPEEKVRLLKEHLVNGVAVSQICEENCLASDENGKKASML